MDLGIGVPNEAILAGPSINSRHIDGPLLMWAGHMHWLTWGERIALRLGRVSVQQLAEEHWPYLAAVARALREASAEPHQKDPDHE